MCPGRNRLIFSLTSVLPGANNFNIEIGGCGGKVEAHFVQQAFIFPTPEPYQQQKQRKTQTWRGGKGKAAHNTKPKTTRKSVRHVQLDLSIHVLGTLPKIPYPDTKVFSLAAACGSTCFSKYLNNVMADRPCRPQ